MVYDFPLEAKKKEKKKRESLFAMKSAQKYSERMKMKKK